MGVYNYGSVNELLAAGGRKRHEKHEPPGYACDHVVELQLLVAAVNGMTAPDFQQPGKLGSMIAFFQQEHNFQPLHPDANLAKGQAITRLIRGQQRHPGDPQRIDSVRSKWIQLRGQLSTLNIPAFVQSMNRILSCW